jgi:hypothetical protein
MHGHVEISRKGGLTYQDSKYQKKDKTVTLFSLKQQGPVRVLLHHFISLHCHGPQSHQDLFPGHLQGAVNVQETVLSCFLLNRVAKMFYLSISQIIFAIDIMSPQTSNVKS